jgi:hypothetical protein
MLSSLKELAKITAFVSIAVFFCTLAIVTHDTAPSVKTALDNVAGVSSTLRTTVDSISKDYYDPKNPEVGFYWDIKSMLETSTMASRTTEETLEDLRASILGGKDTRGTNHEGTIPIANNLLTSVNDIAVDARKDLNRLTDSTDTTLQALGQRLNPLAPMMANIEKLSADLERQMREGGNIDASLEALTKTIEDFDRLVADENVKKILASSAKTSEHLAGSAESVDIALRPWRKKASQLKMVLGKILGLIKISYTL